MKKKGFLFFSVLALCLVCLTGCGTAKVEPQTVKVAALSGPTGMGMAQMITDGVNLGDGVTTEFTVATAPDQLVSQVINGDYQIAALPTNTAATLYKKTNGAIELGAVNTLGTLSIVSKKEEKITSIKDLKGKTIVATGQGSSPEYVLNYLLSKNGLTPGTDVTIEWLGEHSEAAAKL
ncbi:MAG: PhnD/SsuA/transferrin family substrate-binding protein, partial [Eubacteriaceae bacterium]|nr:PhnD/SsuA/transferrin family substrate-binding protein [Eubacteriaceae bacterium]